MSNFARCVAILLTALPSVARADLFLHAWEDHHESVDVLSLSGDMRFFSTHVNYDGYGTLMTPNGLTQYSRIETDANLIYGLTSRLSAFARGTWARIDLDHATRPGTTFGLADQTVGLNYRIFENKNRNSVLGTLDLQIQVDLPAYSNTAADENLTPWFGDQSTDLSFGGFLTGRLLQNSRAELMAVAGAGYTFRGNSLSASIPWSAGLQYLPRLSGLSAGLTAFGISSLQTDPRAQDIALVNSTSVSYGSGGSYIAGSINPMLLSVRGTIGYQSDENLAFTVGATQTVFGKNAPSGLAIEFGIGKRLGGGTKDLQGRSQEYAKGNKGFVDYTFEARVLRTSGSMNIVKIDKGSQEGVEVGQLFDIFTLKTDGSLGEPVARAKVTAIKGNEAVLSVVEYFKEVWIEEGFIAKRPL